MRVSCMYIASTGSLQDKPTPAFLSTVSTGKATLVVAEVIAWMKNMDTKHINSQINEQANAGLQRIKGQLANMKPANFMFTLSLFLAITNQSE